MHRRTAPVLFALLVALLVTTPPALAYTIFLKDGSQIIAKEKYRVEGDRAVFTLASGTPSFIPVDQIDVARTDSANKANLGTAVIIEGGKAKDISQATKPITKPTIKDYIADRELRALPEVKRSAPATAGEVTKTTAGYDDLFGYERAAHPDLEGASRLRALFRQHGVDDPQVYRGTRNDRPLVEIVTNSEAAVFQAIETSARVLVEVRKSQPQLASALELVLVTQARARAGQFVITPADAELITGGKVETPVYFVRNVQF